MNNSAGVTEVITDKQRNFFLTAHQVFLQAEQNTGSSVVRFFSVGGFTIKLKFACPELVRFIVPALEHLAITECAEASLTICLWDSESTGTQMPSPPWTVDDYSARGEIQDYNNSSFFTACHKGSGALSVLDLVSNTALWWIRRSSEVPFYETGSPLLTILHWWLQQKGRQVVHAGAVGTREAGVLLAGKSGSGKSSTTLACLNSELFYAGDDYCILHTSPSPYVFSLYSSGKLNEDHIKKYPHLPDIISNKENISSEKALLLLKEYYPNKLLHGFPVKAIFLPRITGLQDTTLTKTTGAIGLKALAPNTIFQLSYAGHQAFSQIVKFVKQLPCFYLNVGTDINGIPAVISKYLDDNYL